MVEDLIAQLQNHCAHLFQTNQLLQPTSANNTSSTDISDAINQLVRNYLLQTRALNWIIDYDISTQLDPRINLDPLWFNALLITLFEIAICRSNTLLGTELFINIAPSGNDLSILNISIKGKLATPNTVTPWQEILLNKLCELSKFYKGKIQGLPSQAHNATENTIGNKGQVLISYSFNIPAA